jgi:hypothetical protein
VHERWCNRFADHQSDGYCDCRGECVVIGQCIVISECFF